MRRMKEVEITHKAEKEYWDVKDLEYLLSFNCDYTVVSSVRNLGKSYAGMTHARMQIEKGKTVLWERYSKDEFGMAVKAWQATAPNLVKTDTKGYHEYVDEVTGGKLLLVQTSVATNLKGYDDLPDKLPVFEYKDEFLPVRYLNANRFLNEYSDAMEIRKTFKRNGPMRSIYLSNCLNWMNPYTVNWNIPPIDTGKARIVYDTYSVKLGNETISDTRSIIWESVKPTDAQIRRILRTEVSSMNVKDLDSYLDNEFYKEYNKVERCPDMSVQLQPIQLMSEGYYMSYRIYNGRYYFCKVKPNKTVNTYVSEKACIDIDTQHYRYPAMAKDFEDKFNDGLCIFDSSQTLMAYQRWLINLRKRA